MTENPRFDALACLRALGAGEAPAMTARIETRARVRFAVAQGLARGALGFHYQPVVRADAPGFVAFHEMLARLTLPDGRVLPAAAFMPHVVDGPLGRTIDRLALDRALAALAADPGLRLAINLSPRSMGDAAWLDRLQAAAAADRRATARLIVEISETAAVSEADQTRDFIAVVRGLGCAVALDDFGAGATGFRHFRALRADLVKLDGAFTRGLAGCRDAQVLVESLVAIARHFEMVTVAERVELPEDAEALRRLGVDCLQGYLYGRPAARPTGSAARFDEGRRRAG